MALPQPILPATGIGATASKEPLPSTAQLRRLLSMRSGFTKKNAVTHTAGRKACINPSGFVKALVRRRSLSALETKLYCSNSSRAFLSYPVGQNSRLRQFLHFERAVLSSRTTRAAASGGEAAADSAADKDADSVISASKAGEVDDGNSEDGNSVGGGATAGSAAEDDLPWKGFTGRVAYHGSPGGPELKLAQQLCPKLEPLPLPSHEDCFWALTHLVADKALVPVENSQGGSVHRVLDHLSWYKVTIEREALHVSKLCFAVYPETDMENIRTVMAETCDSLQCKEYLSKLQDKYQNATTTIKQARVAKDQRKYTAHIVTEEFALLEGLIIEEKNIQDNSEGHITRFLLIARGDHSSINTLPNPVEPYKTSLVLVFDQKPRQLLNILTTFLTRNIDLTKIESRPYRKDPIKPGRILQYSFYLDFLGGLSQTSVQDAIIELKEFTEYLKILGSYPADRRKQSILPPPKTDLKSAEGHREEDESDFSDLSERKGAGLLLREAANMVPEEVEEIEDFEGRVAYQGLPGAYSESAVRKLYSKAQAVPFAEFEHAFMAVSQCLVDRAVVPVENSLGGSVHAVYDLLVRYNLFIVGEVTIDVNHCLLVLPGVKIWAVKEIMSHYQALAQCDGYLRKLQIPGVPHSDTAGAARDIQRFKMTDKAAIASAVAGKHYGLEVLESDIQDNKGNVTRFLALSTDPRVKQIAGVKYKTSIIFTLKDGPGELFKACLVFARRGLDLTKIESRPMRTKSVRDNLSRTGEFRYLFYLDFIAGISDRDQFGKNALRELKHFAPYLRVLGCYPMDDGINKVKGTSDPGKFVAVSLPANFQTLEFEPADSASLVSLDPELAVSELAVSEPTASMSTGSGSTESKSKDPEAANQEPVDCAPKDSGPTDSDLK